MQRGKEEIISRLTASQVLIAIGTGVVILLGLMLVIVPDERSPFIGGLSICGIAVVLATGIVGDIGQRRNRTASRNEHDDLLAAAQENTAHLREATHALVTLSAAVEQLDKQLGDQAEDIAALAQIQVRLMGTITRSAAPMLASPPGHPRRRN